ncbi:class I SAM-dependent methyltransferase [Bacillaceae bacterium W0354]
MSMWHEEAKKQWDERASSWNANSEEMWENGSRKTIIPFFERHVPKGSTVLDIGCGDGYGSYKLWRIGYHVTGVDISDEMIALCRERKTIEMDQLAFLQADMLNLPFKNESFDSVMAINSLEWAEVPAEAIKHIISKVKPGGYLCVGVLGPTAMPRVNSYKRLYGESVIMNTMMPWEFEQLAEEHGLKIIDSEGVFKRGVTNSHLGSLSLELRQSLSFMWLYLLQK